ncbi:MAG: barstar family protein [Oscillospiraceae bacterium]|nr:barstar family protein [Oscillospiraceae bacterium]
MEYIFDAQNVRTCGAFHARLKELLAFPDWYGGNLDALYDCLTDLPRGTRLVIRNFAAMEACLGPRYTAKLRRVFNDAAAEGRFCWEEA